MSKNKPIVVCFKNNKILSREIYVEKAVSTLLCAYCTLDWKYKVYESDNEIRVKLLMIKKHRFPEHNCKNTLAPCGIFNSIKYCKEVD